MNSNLKMAVEWSKRRSDFYHWTLVSNKSVLREKKAVNNSQSRSNFPLVTWVVSRISAYRWPVLSILTNQIYPYL